MISGLQYRKIQPTSNSVGTGFANTLEFNWSLGSNEKLIWSDCFLSVTLQCATSTAGAFGGVWQDIITFSNSPLHNFFSDSSLRLNNTEISRTSDHSQTGFVHQALTQSGQKVLNNNSSNPITNYQRVQLADNAAILASRGVSGIQTKESLGILNNAIDPQVVTVCGKIPLFLTQDELTGNISMQMRLTVDPSWRNRVGLHVQYTETSLGVPMAAPAAAGVLIYLHLDVVDVNFYIRLYESNEIPRSVKSVYSYTEFVCTSRAMQAGTGVQRYSFNVPKSVSMILFAFYDSRSSANLAFSPNEFSPVGLTGLQTYQLRYDGKLIPSLKTTMNLLSGYSANRGENLSVFKSFIYETTDLSPNGSQYDARSWLSNPIFAHTIAKIAGSEVPLCELELEFSVAPTNTILYFACLSPHAVDVVYNDVGIVSSVSKYELA